MADDVSQCRSCRRRRPALPSLLLVLLTLVASGCLTLRQSSSTAMPAKSAQGVIFVADGAGNFQIASRTLRELIERERLPLHVITFEWSHGRGRVLADQLGFRYALVQGKRLAVEMEEFARQHPDTPIYLAGHSAGSTVVLSALEHAPPELVERAFLLSPSVSTRYDIRPAVHSVKHGLHVFYSRHDWVYLGLATHLLGTADRHYVAPAAGRVGFHVPSEDGDFALQSKLFQRPWRHVDAQTGNLGGHYGNYSPAFLKRHLLPLLQQEF